MRKVAERNNIKSKVSNCLMADEIGFGWGPPRRVLKACGIRPLKHVKQVHNYATKMANRHRLAGELVALYERGMRNKDISRPGDT